MRRNAHNGLPRRLRDAGIPAMPIGAGAGEPDGGDGAAGFGAGAVSIQDTAAQLAVPLLEVGPSLRLDACAACGGTGVRRHPDIKPA